MKRPSLVVYFSIHFAWVLIGPGILAFLLFALLDGGKDLSSSAAQAFGAAALGGLMYASLMTTIKTIGRCSESEKEEPIQAPLPTSEKCPTSNHDQLPGASDLSDVGRKKPMAVQYPKSKDEVSRPGDSTKRIVLFLFGSLFAVLAIAIAAKKEFGIAAAVGLPALLFIAIALWGSRQTVAAAKEFTDITNLPS